MKEALLDALIDSFKVFVVIVLIYIILSFVEDKISHSKKFSKQNKLSPLIGASAGLIPQCGLSVVASDMYIKEHITMGTLVATFIATSDEALPIMLSEPKKIKWILPVLLIKLVVGFIVGYLVDLIYRHSNEEVHEHLDHCHHHEEVHVGCCHHHIDDEKENPLHKHLVHPLLHSLKIFAYVLAVNIVFSLIVYYVGDDAIINFISKNKYVAPLFTTLVGMIPNCASSVIITELYITSGLSFGATMAGLIMNAGLGMVILLKNKNVWKKTAIIWGIMIATALVVGYFTCLIIGF